MPDDGWSEPWPRRDDLGVWARFVESIDVDKLEDERHGSLEQVRRERGTFAVPPPPPLEDHLAELIAATSDRTPEQARALAVAARRENQHHDHTNGTAA